LTLDTLYSIYYVSSSKARCAMIARCITGLRVIKYSICIQIVVPTSNPNSKLATPNSCTQWPFTRCCFISSNFHVCNKILQGGCTWLLSYCDWWYQY